MDPTTRQAGHRDGVDPAVANLAAAAGHEIERARWQAGGGRDGVCETRCG